VITGGESGHHARPAHPEWSAAIRDQCIDAGIKFLFKQYGNWKPLAPGEVSGYRTKTLFLSDGDTIILANVGKKKAGPVLEGRTWDEFPAPAAT
jgi:protein gp37